MDAYVLIQTQPDAAPVAPLLRAIPGVVAAEDVSGAYDAIALARSGSERNLTDEVLAAIRRVPGVTHALPAPLIDGPHGSKADPSGRPPVAQGAAA
jgi:DNA-binding Lrp family transcriptional regulator